MVVPSKASVASNGHASANGSDGGVFAGLHELWEMFPHANENDLSKALESSRGDVNAAAAYLRKEPRRLAEMEAAAKRANISPAVDAAHGSINDKSKGYRNAVSDVAVVKGGAPYLPHFGNPAKYVLLAKTRVLDSVDDKATMLCELDSVSCPHVVKVRVWCSDVTGMPFA